MMQTTSGGGVAADVMKMYLIFKVCFSTAAYTSLRTIQYLFLNLCARNIIRITILVQIHLIIVDSNGMFSKFKT